MSNFITKDELAKIAISKNLIKEYKGSNSERTVYLNDGTEFQIYLKNPYQTHLGIRIYVNNQSIGNMLVLKPGQSYWLDRFVNENKRFLFSTYEVENTAEMKYATNNNGKVKIEFYHEREENQIISVYPSNRNIGWNYYNSGNVNTITYQNLYDDCSTSTCYYSASTIGATSGEIPTASSATTITTSAACTNRSVDDSHTASRKKGVSRSLDATIETGRVEKGGHSDQEFEYCDIDFDYYPFKTENIQILPNSRKQIRVEETRRKYCSQCGKKVSPKDKFCSNCGAKLT